jgi:hypothetical protein
MWKNVRRQSARSTFDSTDCAVQSNTNIIANIDFTTKCNGEDKGLSIPLKLQRSKILYPGALAKENTYFQFS